MFGDHGNTDGLIQERRNSIANARLFALTHRYLASIKANKAKPSYVKINETKSCYDSNFADIDSTTDKLSLWQLSLLGVFQGCTVNVDLNS